jgi:Fe-S oxidoreductase/coenzyme F420-reducing hydrogenase delta subunit
MADEKTAKKTNKTRAKAFEPEIIAFTCNWCAYAGADYAGVSRIQYPANVRIIRVMCSGRVEPYFILKAFEEGADGVLVGGCHEADCHYISGNLKARERVQSTGELLDLLGLGSERLRIKWVNANEGEAFAQEISDFSKELSELGPNPMKNTAPRAPVVPDAFDVMSRTDALLCVECGKCTASCPVARRDVTFSPRGTVEQSLEKMHTEIETGQQLWDCLTCRICEQRCPYNVRFSEFVRDSRVEAQTLGRDGSPTQAGAMYSWMRIMGDDGLEQRRLSWLVDDLKVKPKATAKTDVMFFVGCLPHFDVSHRHTGSNSAAIARDSVAILNAMGITPVVVPDERCCGHDLLYGGDPEGFRALAERNARAIKEAGVSRIVVSCPEGYQTLAQEYPRVLKNWNVEVMHLSELMAEKLDSGKLVLENDLGLKATYQDPCRLGRYMGVYDAPRRVLESIPGVELVEMEHSGPDAICCGVSSWLSCGATAKSIQLARLREARATGADVLVTTCPKCQIHFRCALSGKVPGDRAEVDIPIEDLTSLVVRAIRDGSGKTPAGSGEKKASPRAGSKKPAGEKAPGRKAGGEKPEEKKASSKKAPAGKAPSKKPPAKKATAKKAAGKRVSKSRGES